MREVACARLALPRPDHPGEVLSLRVALIRDLRRLVPVPPNPEDGERPPRWDADLGRTERQWWEDGWQATAAPATQTTPKLIPIVTTAETIDAVELAHTYIHRWPAQHGYAKEPVVNSELAKRQVVLEGRTQRLEHLAQASRARLTDLRDQDQQLQAGKACGAQPRPLEQM